MTEKSNAVPEFLQATRTGASFYESAADATADRKLSKLFKRLAQAKATLVQDLEKEVDRKTAKGKGSWTVDIEKIYAAVREARESRAEQVEQLDRVEGSVLLRAQQIVMDKQQCYVVRVLAQQYVTRINAVREELRARKRTAAAAAAAA